MKRQASKAHPDGATVTVEAGLPFFSLRERIPRKLSRLEPVNLADEGPKDLRRTKNEFPIFVFPESLGRFMERMARRRTVDNVLKISARYEPFEAPPGRGLRQSSG